MIYKSIFNYGNILMILFAHIEYNGFLNSFTPI